MTGNLTNMELEGGLCEESPDISLSVGSLSDDDTINCARKKLDLDVGTEADNGKKSQASSRANLGLMSKDISNVTGQNDNPQCGPNGFHNPTSNRLNGSTSYSNDLNCSRYSTGTATNHNYSQNNSSHSRSPGKRIQFVKHTSRPGNLMCPDLIIKN